MLVINRNFQPYNRWRFYLHMIALLHAQEQALFQRSASPYMHPSWIKLMWRPYTLMSQVFSKIFFTVTSLLERRGVKAIAKKLSLLRWCSTLLPNIGSNFFMKIRTNYQSSFGIIMPYKPTSILRIQAYWIKKILRYTTMHKNYNEKDNTSINYMSRTKWIKHYEFLSTMS